MSGVRGYQEDVSPDTQSVEGTLVRSTTVLLIRHAHTDAIGQWLCGRRLGITLSVSGREQAEELARALATTVPFEAVYTSPLERAHMTASAIARHQPTHLHVCDELVDIDFGEWSGKTFAELDTDPAWHAFNAERARAAVPGGEQPTMVQQRIVAAIAGLAAAHQGASIAVVSHADVIRFALLHYRSTTLDRYHEIEIDPASVSAVSLSRAGARILFVNRDASAMRSYRHGIDADRIGCRTGERR
jgi:broad specificity phosphatase PhoE